MLKSIRNDLVYVLSILNAIAKIKKYTESYNTAEDFFKANDQLNFNACLTLLANIGENANKLSDELKKKYTDIEWTKIISYRNRVVHDYKSINIFITFEIVKVKLVELELNICKIIENEIISGNFDKEEYKIASKSEFYKFIDFGKIKCNAH